MSDVYRAWVVERDSRAAKSFLTCAAYEQVLAARHWVPTWMLLELGWPIEQIPELQTGMAERYAKARSCMDSYYTETNPND